MNQPETIVLHPLPGEPCPHCLFGRRPDASFCHGSDGQGNTIMSYRPGSKCPTCDGTGRVYITYTPARTP